MTKSDIRRYLARHPRVWRCLYAFVTIVFMAYVSETVCLERNSHSTATDHNTTPKISESRSGLPWEHVCIIGNAEHASDAIRTHHMWNDKYPSFWLVWGEPLATPSEKLPQNIRLLQIERKTSWAEGIEFTLEQLRKHLDCEYIFTHDDDLEFFTSHDTNRDTLSSILSTMLLKYQPAVVGFPWSVGDTTVEGMMGLASKFKGREVVPLTGFDSGMVIYHKSIVNFFIPYTPRGEGGFHGHWSLCAHFLNLFGPNLLEGKALRMNTIKYSNLISFDNVPEDERSPTKISKSGLIVHAESRHPYEYHMNQPFRTFLANGMLNRQRRWGRDLTSADILWDVELPQRIFTDTRELKNDHAHHWSVDKWTVISKLVEFYDIHHPVLSKNKWIRESFTDNELTSFLRSRNNLGLDFSIVIHIFTLDRRESLEALWTSINEANKIKRKVSFHIHLDTAESDNNAPFFLYGQYLQSLESIHGPITISINSKKKGLRQSIMDAWTPVNSEEYAIFLEDDISVSRHFLEYSEQMIARYLSPRGSPGYSPRCIGVSLYNQKYDEVNDKDWSVSTGQFYSPYLLQQPQSWGAIYTADGWNDFRKWYLAQTPNFDPLIPSSLTNRWPKSRSWKKFMLRYMYTKGKVLLYPNFPGGVSLSTNRLEIGTNDRISGDQRTIMLERFQVPLLDLRDNLERNHPEMFGGSGAEFLKRTIRRENGKTFLDLTTQFIDRSFEYPFGNDSDSIKPLLPGSLLVPSLALPPMNQLKVFDVHYAPVKDIHSLVGNISPKSFDKCTLILQVDNNTSLETVHSTLLHYHEQPQLDSMVLAWNRNDGVPRFKAPDASKKALKKKIQYEFKIPIKAVKPTTLSPNIKFMVTEHAPTDCIILAHPSALISHDQLRFAISLFQGHFFNNIIGFAEDGLFHSFDSNSNSFKLERVAGTGVGISVVGLPRMVIHKKYLERYLRPSMAVARKIVDAESGCDVILMNLIVANETNMGPVIISSDGEPSIIDAKEESRCLDIFRRKVFTDRLPLKYTKSTFTAPKPQLKRSMKVMEYPDEITPSLKQLKYSDSK
ncbi:hypothetical protein HDU83_007641 [Entophlyctis luteolus]|nr:hypothetical protein HDU83_007641 [Entophlyctis luteolus]